MKTAASLLLSMCCLCLSAQPQLPPAAQGATAQTEFDGRARAYISPQRVVWKYDGGGKLVENADILLEKGNGQAGTNFTGVCTIRSTSNEIGAILLDYGVELHGGLQLVNCQPSKPGPTKVRIRFGESATVEEFRIFIEKELKEDVNALESSRKSMRKMMVLGGIMAGISIVGVMGYVFYNMFTVGSDAASTDYTFNPLKSVVPIFILMIVLAFVFNIIMKKRQAKTKDAAPQTLAFGTNTFKEKIISKMVAFVNPSVKYIPMAHLSLNDVFESGLFEERNYKIDGSDQISGRHNGVPFIACDLDLQYKRKFSEEKEQPEVIFYGQFFVARFNKKFNSPVYVIPTSKKSSGLISGMGEQVQLEDPEFMKMFRVYAYDQIEARYILTPSLMERLKELAKRTKGSYHVAFYNNKITVANNSGINNFEVGYTKSLTKKENELLIDFYTDLCNQFAIIDELKLNINIWKKL